MSLSLHGLWVILQPPEVWLELLWAPEVPLNTGPALLSSLPQHTHSISAVTISAPLPQLLSSLAARGKTRITHSARVLEWQPQGSSSSTNLTPQSDDLFACLGSLGQLVLYLAPTPVSAPTGEGRNPQLLNTCTGAEAKDHRRVGSWLYHWGELIECLLCAWHDVPSKWSEPLESEAEGSGLGQVRFLRATAFQGEDKSE